MWMNTHGTRPYSRPVENTIWPSPRRRARCSGADGCHRVRESSHRISVTRAERANSTTSRLCSHSVKIWDEEPTTLQKNLAGSLPSRTVLAGIFTLADRQ